MHYILYPTKEIFTFSKLGADESTTIFNFDNSDTLYTVTRS